LLPESPRSTPKTPIITTPNPTAARKPRLSMTHAAGSDKGMKAIMKTIASSVTSWCDTW